ncbi:MULTISPECIES: hypothetical protein [Cyanophyceae]|uniref:Uncharacterized protein n=1 Tax=Aphanothece cf. minutissima CCALA 015 TaxID=2107695 RepID=A0ABX5F7W1_9CHRO|nr:MULTISPECIES: hypothetical protein [Cyanophyceae]MCP9797461.1 hypothetical protein [Cyanobium sp. Lug-B]PSB37692.1 hypothetical protein C7B81_09335 [Aphanothece cf. minutissima CCALA 015]
MAALTQPFLPLLLAIAAPLLWGWRWRRPSWQMLLLGVGSWAAIGWLSLLPAGPTLRQAYGLLVVIDLLVVAVTVGIRPQRWRQRLADPALGRPLLAVLAPALVCAIALALRGVVLEFPSDGFVYYTTYFGSDLLDTVRLDPVRYRAPANWFFTAASYLFGFPDALAPWRASLVAALNTFLVLTASCQLCLRLTGRVALAWLTALLFLLGMGHQNFSFFHQIALNGTLPGLALLLAAATPLLRLLQRPCWPGARPLGAATALLLGAAYLAYHAHGVTAFLTVNLLIVATAASLVVWPSRRRLGVSLALAGLVLLALNRLPWPERLASFYAWPETMRFVHDYRLLGHRFFYFWPSLPVATWEPVFLAALGLSLACAVAWRGRRPVPGAVLALALLPPLVLLEWWAPFVSDLVFKLIEPDSAYRLVWTSLFWISIPAMARALDPVGRRQRFWGLSWARGILMVLLAGLIAVLAVPLGLQGETNVFASKVPHLLTPLEEVRPADGATIEPILEPLQELCEREPRLQGRTLLSDPFVGAVLGMRQCLVPLAARDITRLAAPTVETGQYPGLRSALASPAALRAWLDGRRVDVVLLRDAYPPYESRIARASNHWQPDLVSRYGDLSINRLSTAQLARVGFPLVRHAHGMRLYLRTPPAPR